MTHPHQNRVNSFCHCKCRYNHGNPGKDHYMCRYSRDNPHRDHYTFPYSFCNPSKDHCNFHYNLWQRLRQPEAQQENLLVQ